MSLGTDRLRRSDRLRSSLDYRRIARDGRRHACTQFVLLVAPARGEATETSRRLGITASRKVGNAVARNRVKRRVREWFRVGRGSLPPQVDVVVIARQPARDLTGAEMGQILDELARRATRGGQRAG